MTGAGACARKPGVLILVENLPVPFDRRVWREARSLAAAGHAVTVVCPQAGAYRAPREELEGVSIRRHPLPFEAKGPLGYLLEYPLALFWQFRLALGAFLERGFDVVQVCNPPDLLFLVAGFFKLGFGVRVIFDHHDLCPEYYEAKFGARGLLYRVLLALERWTFRTADLTLATNESYREVAIHRGKMPADRVRVVRSLPDPDRFLDPGRAWTRPAGWRHAVGYVGVIGQAESLDLLLESLRIIKERRRREGVGCVIVGDGPSRDDVERLAGEMGLDGDVLFTGRVPDEVLFGILRGCDLCVAPDRANPMSDLSTMNKVLEYMALGRPIVQFDLKEGRRSAGEASLYARANDAQDFADRILEVLDEPEKAARMGRFGRERVERELRWDLEERVLLRAYEDVLADGARV